MTAPMLGRRLQVCRMGRCRCCNAHDPKGRRSERRLAKRRERQALRRRLR